MTVMEIDDFRNKSMRETEEDINMRLLQNTRWLTRDVLEKRRVLCGTFPSHLEKLLAMIELYGIIARCTILLS